MSQETRKQRQRRVLVDDILDAARSQLDAGGPGSVSLRGIGRVVGMSAPSLYTYFPSLADLFTALIVQSYDSLAHAVSQAVAASASEPIGDRLQAGPVAYRRWALTNRQQFNLIFSDQISGYQAPVDGPTTEAQVAVLRPIAEQYAIAQGIEIAQLSTPGDQLDLFIGWWGAFHGLVTLEVNHHLDWVDAQRIFDARLRSEIERLTQSEPTSAS